MIINLLLSFCVVLLLFDFEVKYIFVGYRDVVLRLVSKKIY